MKRQRQRMGTGIMSISYLLIVLMIAALTACGGGGGKVVKGVNTTPPAAPAWTKQLGSEEKDEASSVAVDREGNIYVAGFTEGDLDGNKNLGKTNFFLVKYSPSGVKVWTKVHGTAQHDYAHSVAVDSKGNIYVTGRTSGHMDGNENAGSYDLFFVKYDSSGVKQWTKQLSAGDVTEGHSVAVDSKDNIYVAGVGVNFPRFNSLLIKYDSSGTEQVKQRELGGAGAWGVAVDREDNIYVAGVALGSWGDIFLLRYSLSPTKPWTQWTKQLGTKDKDVARSVAVDSKGNIYVAGFTDGDLDGNKNLGKDDFFLVKYSPSGVKEWSKQDGTTKDDYAYGVAVDSKDNIYVAGFTKGDLDSNKNLGKNDFFLIKYNPSGVKEWTRQHGTAKHDNAYGVAIDSKDNIYVVGATEGSLDGNKNAGGADLFIVKYDSSGVKQ